MADLEQDEKDEDRVETISEQQLFELRHIFSEVDQDNDGLIRIKDIATIFKRFDENLKPFIIEENDLKNLLDRNNIHESGQITFTQFLTLIACKLNVNDTAEELQQAFFIFDPTNSGFITAKDLVRVMHSIGERITLVEAEEMMRYADRDLNGKIGFAEFVEMMRYS